MVNYLNFCMILSFFSFVRTDTNMTFSYPGVSYVSQASLTMTITLTLTLTVTLTYNSNTNI